MAWRRLRKTRTLDAPEPKRLLAQLGLEAEPFAPYPERSRRLAIADLNQRLSDVEFELDLLPARFMALTRICLASCTGLALFGYMGAASIPPSERIFGLASCGCAAVMGAGFILTIGRMAKRRSVALRAAWDRTSRETAKSLETSLSAPLPGRHSERLRLGA